MQAQRRQREALLELLDHVFAIGAAVVVTPRRQRRFARRQARDQRLEHVARHVEKFFAGGVRTLGHTMADEDQPARMRPAERLIFQLCDVGAAHCGRRPHEPDAQPIFNRLGYKREFVARSANLPGGGSAGQ